VELEPGAGAERQGGGAAGVVAADEASSELSRLDERDRAGELSKRAMEGFLAARGWEAKSEFVFNADEAGVSMEAFYAEHDEDAFRGLVTLDGALLDEATGLWVGALNIWESGKPNYVLAYVVGNDERGYKVDWNWYEQMKTQALQDFFSRPMGEPRELRVMIRRSSFLGKTPEGEEEPLSVVLMTPFSDPYSGMIYVAPEEGLASELKEKLRWGEDRMATVKLGWVSDHRYGDAPRVVIEELVGWGLAIENAFPEE
jgi:hypothetical protein